MLFTGCGGMGCICGGAKFCCGPICTPGCAIPGGCIGIAFGGKVPGIGGRAGIRSEPGILCCPGPTLGGPIFGGIC